jgi:hypothetical protein
VYIFGKMLSRKQSLVLLLRFRRKVTGSDNKISRNIRFVNSD